MRLPLVIHSLILNYVLEMHAYDWYVELKARLRMNDCLHTLNCVSFIINDQFGGFHVRLVLDVLKYIKKHWSNT